MQNKNQIKTIREFTNELVIYLQEKTPKASGKLVNSYSGNFTEDNININALEYFKFVEFGVNGTETNWGSPYSFSDKMIPISTIQSYANSRGINVYAMQKSIFKKGIKPKELIVNNLNNKLDDFGNDFLNAMWNDFKLDNPDEKIN